MYLSIQMTKELYLECPKKELSDVTVICVLILCCEVGTINRVSLSTVQRFRYLKTK
jgi:hypothetical protein